MGGAGRARRRPRRRRRVPPRQALRRRAHPAGHRGAGAARPRRLGARPRHQPRPARHRVRLVAQLPWPGGSLPDLRGCGAAAGAGRPDPGGRAEGRGGAVRRGAGGGRRARWRAGSPAWCSPTAATPTSCAAAAWSSPTARVRRWAGCWAGSGTATPPTAWPRAATSRSGRSDDEWISSHLELRGEDGEVLAGYGWVFPLSDGEVNIGVGTLATARAPSPDPAAQPHPALRRRAPGGLAARRPGAPARVRAPADGRRGVARRRPQLGAHRRRRGLCEPAQRRGHRLRPGDGQAGRRADRRRSGTWAPAGPPPSATTTGRRSRSRGASRACSRCPGCCRWPDRSGWHRLR